MLEVKNLTKSYHRKMALNNVSMTFQDGLYALLGPNGAGKSTLINIITDNLNADKGEVLFGGTVTKKLAADFRRVLGFMPQQQGLYDTFTGRRFLGYMAALKQIQKRQIGPEIEKVAATVNLSSELDKRIGAYSGGMKQRVLIAQAIIGDPQLLILDEPTAGLDPKERLRMRNLIADLSKGRIVMIATHVVSDIEAIADEIILLKSGEVVAKAAASELIEKYAPGQGVEDVYMKLFAGDESAEENVC